jgi:hypothetical protein
MRELLCFSACLCVSVPITFYRFHDLPSFPDALYLRKFSYKPQRANCIVLFREIQNEKKNLEGLRLRFAERKKCQHLLWEDMDKLRKDVDPKDLRQQYLICNFECIRKKARMKEMLERIGVLHEASSKGAGDKSLNQRLEFSQFDLSQEVKQLELDIKELEKCLPKLVKEEKRQRQQRRRELESSQQHEGQTGMFDLAEPDQLPAEGETSQSFPIQFLNKLYAL